jgi:recombination protein RecA
VIQTGGFGGWQVGPKRKATGGGAIKFALSQRVEFTHKAKLKGRSTDVTGAEAEGVIGKRVIAKVVKNKVAPPWRTMEFDLVDGLGFDQMRHLIELGIATGVIGKKGAFLEVPGLAKSVQGVAQLAAVLRDHRAANVLDSLEGAIKTELEKTAQSVEVGDVDQEEGGDDGSEVADQEGV